MPTVTDRDGVVGPVALDATPLLGPTTGVGRYVRRLVEELARDPRAEGFGLVTVSSRRGARGLDVPPGPWRRSLRVPAPVWRRSVPGGSRAVDAALRPARLWHMTNFVAPRPHRLPYTVTVHDLAYLHLPGHVNPGAAGLRRLVPQVLAGAAAVVTISGTTRDDLREAYPWLDAPVVVAPLGVDPRWFDLPAAAEVPRPGAGGTGYVLAVGTREPRKNLGTLVRAHRRARRSDPTVPRLVLLGRPGWGPDLDGERADPADVTLVEDADDARLVALLHGARALVAPSHREGFALPVLEAMAAGVPVLASDVGAHRELLAGAGRLLAPDDAEAWALALADLPRPGTPAVEAARARARGYTWRRTAEVHLGLWQAVLTGADASSGYPSPR